MNVFIEKTRQTNTKNVEIFNKNKQLLQTTLEKFKQLEIEYENTTKQLANSNEQANGFKLQIQNLESQIKTLKQEFESKVLVNQEEFQQLKQALEILRNQQDPSVAQPPSNQIFTIMFNSLKRAIVVIEKIFQNTQQEEQLDNTMLSKRRRIIE